MDFRILLAELRWGDALTTEDRMFVRSLSFDQLFRSSYLLAKTPRVKYDRILRRR